MNRKHNRSTHRTGSDQSTTGRSTLRRGAKIAVLAAAGAIAIPSIVGAVTGGSPTPQRATGCLKTDGSVVQFALGDAPRAACTSTQKQITVGNGDVTGLTPGNGLMGGGTEGTLSLGLAPSFTLPQGCATGATPKANWLGWYCGNDNGSLKTTVAAPAVDHQTAPHNGSYCVGDVSGGYVPPYTSSVPANSASFTLPGGTYMPTIAAATKWYVNRTYDMLDGEQFTKGYVRMQIVRTRAGVDTTVATWARVESSNQDGTGIPWVQDLGTFVASSNDTYRIVTDGMGAYCSRARLLTPGIDFTLVG